MEPHSEVTVRIFRKSEIFKKFFASGEGTNFFLTAMPVKKIPGAYRFKKF
jgi:hypothetical protein